MKNKDVQVIAMHEELVLDIKFECHIILVWYFVKNVNHSLRLE